tara:strand:+ start:395 stop:790 length:396 start_codon:yes stop_codon:yes gene_type:complete
MVTEYLLKPLGDERGYLAAIESGVTIPIDVKRIYYMFGTAEGIVRGRHAHRKLRQFAVCITGSCNVTLDDGDTTEIIKLDNHLKCISLDSMIWHEMSEFSSDCVLLVLADDHYDESDYIRDYEEFLELVRS